MAPHLYAMLFRPSQVFKGHSHRNLEENTDRNFRFESPISSTRIDWAVSICKIPVRFWSRAFPAAPKKVGLRLMATPHPDMPFFVGQGAGGTGIAQSAVGGKSYSGGDPPHS
jgi:hypothetical protein